MNKLKNKLKNNNNEKGQALLFIIIAMSIALSVGISVSSRTVTSLRRTSTSDTSSRVFAAAEGGLEWFLTQPISVLDDMATAKSNRCPSGSVADASNNNACILQYEPQPEYQTGTSPILTDKIQAKSSVAVTKFQFNDISGTSYYWFNEDPGDVKEVSLRDFQTNVYYSGNIDICWNSKVAATQSAVMYLYTYDATGITTKSLIQPAGINGTINITGATLATDYAHAGYPDCYRLAVPANSLGLRMKVLYAPSTVAVFPLSGGFPTQGYKLVSKGQIDNTAEKIVVKKEVTAYKSIPYASGVFDFAIYSQNAIN